MQMCEGMIRKGNERIEKQGVCAWKGINRAFLFVYVPLVGCMEGLEDLRHRLMDV